MHVMAEAVAAAPVEAAPKKSKLLLIIVGVVVLSAAVGGGLYFTIGAKHEPVAKEKSAGEVDPKAPAVYVKIDPPFVVNFESKGMMRFLQITLEVMTRDPAAADLLKQHDPMIRNDLLMLFGNQAYETISTREGKEKLRSDALETVRKIIQHEGGKTKSVEQLYFTSFVMQ
jgi:flagellar FliL protein